MNRYIIPYLLFLSGIFLMGCAGAKTDSYTVTSEFEEQEYIWLTWVESGFLGGEPFKVTAINAMKEITPYVKVRLFYGPQMDYDSAQLKTRIYESLIANNIDTSRITLFYNDMYYGAIQDPGPVFLRNTEGRFAIADFNFLHPDNRTASIDKNVAAHFNLPVISSTMISEGGAWQTNGRGTMLLVESVELDRNKSMTKTD